MSIILHRRRNRDGSESFRAYLNSGYIGDFESLNEAMETILELLADLDYPDGMTGGLRRTTDVARALIERSRADLTTTVVQERLRRQLADE